MLRTMALIQGAGDGLRCLKIAAMLVTSIPMLKILQNTVNRWVVETFRSWQWKLWGGGARIENVNNALPSHNHKCSSN